MLDFGQKVKLDTGLSRIETDIKIELFVNNIQDVRSVVYHMSITRKENNRRCARYFFLQMNRPILFKSYMYFFIYVLLLISFIL